MNQKMAILMMDEERKIRIQNYANETINFIYGKTKDEIEIAYLLKMMVEGYQDAKKMTIPIDMEYKRCFTRA